MIWTLIRMNGWLSIAVNVLMFTGIWAAIIAGIKQVMEDDER